MKTCAVPGCTNRHGSNQVMCRTHWRRVSKETRDWVWNEYRAAPGSAQHRAAMVAAFGEAMAGEAVSA